MEGAMERAVPGMVRSHLSQMPKASSSADDLILGSTSTSILRNPSGRSPPNLSIPPPMMMLLLGPLQATPAAALLIPRTASRTRMRRATITIPSNLMLLLLPACRPKKTSAHAKVHPVATHFRTTRTPRYRHRLLLLLRLNFLLASRSVVSWVSC